MFNFDTLNFGEGIMWNHHCRDGRKILLFGILINFVLVYGNGLLEAEEDRSGISPENQVGVLATFDDNEEVTPEEMENKHNLQLRHSYTTAIQGMSANVSVKRLGQFMDDTRMDRVLFDYKMEPAGEQTAQEKTSAEGEGTDRGGRGGRASQPRKYLKGIHAVRRASSGRSNVQNTDSGTAPVQVGMIDTIANTTHSVITDGSKIKQYPEVSSVTKENIISHLSSQLEEEEKRMFHHGTRTAGVIGGAKSTGVAQGLDIQFYSTLLDSVKRKRSSGKDAVEQPVEEFLAYEEVKVSSVIYGLDHFARKIIRKNQPIDVIYLGLSTEDASHREVLQNAIKTLTSRGVLVVVPAGRENEYIDGGMLSVDTIPAYFSETLTVSALATGEGGNGDYSRLPEWSNAGKQVDLTAPGERFGYLRYDGRKGRGNQHGTSYSSALVTGASAHLIALAKKHQITLSSELLVKILKQTGERPAGNGSWTDDFDEIPESKIHLRRASQYLSRLGKNFRQLSLKQATGQVYFGNQNKADQTIYVATINGFQMGEDGARFPDEAEDFLNEKLNIPGETRVESFDWHEESRTSFKEEKSHSQSVIRVREWIREKYQKRCTGCKSNIVIVGHSFGGKTAMEVAQALKDDGVKIRALVTLDPVKHIPEFPHEPSAMGHVDNWINLHQKEGVVDEVPSIPAVGHVVRGVGAVPELISSGDGADWISTTGGEMGAVDGADENLAPSRAGHMSFNSYYDHWIKSKTTPFPSFQ